MAFNDPLCNQCIATMNAQKHNVCLEIFNGEKGLRPNSICGLLCANCHKIWIRKRPVLRMIQVLEI